MSAAPRLVRAVTAEGAVPRPAATRGPADPPALARLLARLRNEWLPRVAWSISRTGWPGLVGIGLMLATAIFLFSTHLQVVAEIEAQRADLATAHRRARTAGVEKGVEHAGAERVPMPSRDEMPAVLRQLFDEATRAQLAVDTARYEVSVSKGGGGLVRYQLAFPLAGPYPQIRAFLDSTLEKMPAVALTELVLERKSIGSASVEAQIRMTVHATDAGGQPVAGASTAPSARAMADRVVLPTFSSALFEPHSWFVRPPPPKPPPPAVEPPPPEPTAPAFPYTFVGNYAPGSDNPVYFLAHGDRLIDAHVGDRLDGVYQFESAGGGQLVFVYLPLNTRQTLAIGVSK